ncbi:ExeA family protein [Aromatoleum diolicum]|uniref:AAA family ATPase n=1 Tax=Aromatoleum diolicum TaxID=75796 RepID=A0ABX1Q744_9RHOO|nr:ExeA family protein [Aromatoleum diolicum]NMG74133.1 AAA family ATPase [Aromatoleum diolicum]
MYNEYFGFSEAPFSIAPDPRYLFMSERHREALAHLLYGLRVDGGFVLLTGEVGTGKTTICRCLLEQVPDDCDIAFILNPKLDTVELLATLCDELHVPVPFGERSIKVLVDLINRHLLAANARGRKTVLIVDEAQNLSNEVLEQLRLLTNLETNQRKLLQIILLGQPELRERLAQPAMRQLAQRIVARYHLEPLSRPDVAAYINHRLSVAGARQPLFPGPVIERVYRLSGGTPRLINVICDRALLGAYAEGKAAVAPAILNKAAHEVLGAPAGSPAQRTAARRVISACALAVILAGGGAAAWRQHLAAPAEAPVPQVAIAAVPVASAATEAVQRVAREPAELPVAPEDEILRPEASEYWLHEMVAVRALFARWSLDVPPVGIDGACRLAADHNLACLRRVGNLEALRAMNAPAILDMRQPGGPDFFATLVALDSDRARLVFAGRTRDVSLENLQRQWRGNYTLLWRVPHGWYRTVGPGARGKDVAWVVRQLGHWEGLAASEPAGNTYNADVEQRVRAFQRSNGLPEDGVLGPMTLVRLAALADSEAPVLAPQAK